MDWNVAITKNRSDLMKIVAGLYVLAGWVPGGERPTFIGRIARNELSHLLRVTEAALRRLILIMVTVDHYKPSDRKKTRRPLPDFSSFGKSSGKRAPVFSLIDPRKPMVFMDEETFYGTTSQSSQPRIWMLDTPAPLVTVALRQAQGEGYSGNFPPSVAAEGLATQPNRHCVNGREPDGEAKKEDPPNPSHLLRRLEALNYAIKNLPRQAKRMARILEQTGTFKENRSPPWQGKLPRLAEVPARERARAGWRSEKQIRLYPVRPGFPPGHSDRPKHKADDVLRECHGLVADLRGALP